MRLGDLDVVDRADLRFEIFGHVVDKDVAIDLLRLAFTLAVRRCSQLPQQVGGEQCELVIFC